MPVFLDGQQNLSALTVPGAYGDIILPTPFLFGLPTNIEGLVGVGSWGPLNSIIPVSKPTDCALAIGPPVIRNYDVATYVSASSQVGGAIGYLCVRVSDGTDTAASAAILATGGATGMTLSGKYTGKLGSQIQFSIQNGSAANTYMGNVVFPGMVPEQFNNVPGPTPATDTITFTGNPSPSDTVTVAGTLITFVASGATGNQVNIATTVGNTAAALMTLLLGSVDANLIKVMPSINAAQTVITLTANQVLSNGANAGVSGNSLTLAKSSTNITIGATTFSGGVGTWNAFWVNLVAAINNGNPFHGPSFYVVATVGAATTQPVLSTVTTLVGGTDGATNVTDATLMGQDIVPRKGMYVLRSSNVDCFTLCDLSTVADYAAIASFGIQETMTPIFGSPSGDTIANALATRINAGVDTPWFWYLLGDWPSFYDSFNQVTRLVNPSAMGIGICGNLSPQQSPLNKPLQGVSATQRSTLGQTYSDTELSLINQGGIDTILSPPSSPGGYYFSFATGRNASSNTAANGIEYTRMTNFLIRAAQSKAAGSFVGQLQSIQPNDQTRQNAKALFDGFSAQLASSEVGLGINGQGMIDRPWLVQCDLLNNPPDLQARGYLFLYWQVRYLNVIRYFVIKFQGGGNVTVSVQSTQPSPSQFAASANTTTNA